MSKAARQRMENTGGWDCYGAQVMALFDRLLDGQPLRDVRVS
jgi:hypothetical protein